MKNDGQPFDNDWYEYVEYESTNSLTIFFQRNGFKRETADYIREHKSDCLGVINGHYKIKSSILDCPKKAVCEDVAEIKFNVPELFIDE